MESTSQYIGERTILLPFSPSQEPFNTAESPMQDLLSVLYQRTKDDGLLELLFIGDRAPSKDKFIWMLYTKPVVVAFLKPTDGSTPQPIGFGWLLEVEERGGWRKANLAVVFFKKWWGTVELKEVSRLALRWWFVELGVNSLWGVTLTRNRMAQRFGVEMGMRHVATLPKFLLRDAGPEDAEMFYLEREEFLGQENTTQSQVVEAA